MPIIGTTDMLGFGNVEAAPKAEPKKGFFEELFDPTTAAANWRREGIWGSSINAAQNSYYQQDGDPNFDRLPHIEGYEDVWERFTQANSVEEINNTKRYIDRERADANVIHNMGWGGAVQNMAFNLVDPTMLIPGTAIYKSLYGAGAKTLLGGLAKRMVSAAGANAIVTGIQEVGLQATQYERPFEETVNNMLGSAFMGMIIGGGLGAASAYLDTKSYKANAKAMGNALNGVDTKVTINPNGQATVSSSSTAPYNPFGPGGTPVSPQGTPPTGQTGSVGAMVVPPSTMEKATAFFGNSELAKRVQEKYKLSPIFQGLNNRYTTAQRFVNDMFESIIETEGSKFGARSSRQVEVRNHGDMHMLAKALDQVDKLYYDYLGIDGWFKKTKGVYKQYKEGNWLSKAQFEEAIGVANQHGDVHPTLNIPQVNQAAKIYRKSVGDYIKNRSQALGLLAEEPELEQILGAISYFPRKPNVDKIVRERKRFIDEVLIPMFEKNNAAIQRGEYVPTSEGRALMKRAQREHRHGQERQLNRIDKLIEGREKRVENLEKRKQIREKAYQKSEGRRAQAEKKFKDAKNPGDIQKRAEILDRFTGYAQNKKTYLNAAQKRVDLQLEKIKRLQAKRLQTEKFFIYPPAERLKYEAKTNHARKLLDSSDFYSEAGDIVDNLIGWSEETFYNPHLRDSNPGRAALDAFKSRVLDVEDTIYGEWLDTNAREVWTNHFRGISPYLNAREYYKERGWKSIADGLLELKNEVDTMVIRERNPDMKEQLMSEGRKAKQLMIDTEALVMGNYGTNNKDGIDRVIRFGKNVNAWRLSGKVLFSAFSDINQVVGADGVKAFIMDGIRPMVKNLKASKLAKDQLIDAAIGIEALMPERFEHLRAALNQKNPNLNGLEKFNMHLAGKASGLNLMQYWTTFWDRVYGHMSSARTIRSLMHWAGTGQMDPREMKRLGRLGIGQDAYAGIAKMLSQHATELDGSFFSNLEKWKNTPEGKLFSNATLKDVRTTVVRTGKGDIPFTLQKTEVGRAIASWRNFSFGATNRILIPALQKKDSATLQMIVASMVTGVATYTARQLAKGEEVDFSPERLAVEALDNSGLLGIIAEGYNIADKTNLLKLIGRPFGLNLGSKASRYRSRGPWSAIFGPVFGLGEDLYDVTTRLAKENKSSEDFVKAAELFVPYYKLFYVHWLFKEATKAMAQGAGYPESNSNRGSMY